MPPWHPRHISPVISVLTSCPIRGEVRTVHQADVRGARERNFDDFALFPIAKIVVEELHSGRFQQGRPYLFTTSRKHSSTCDLLRTHGEDPNRPDAKTEAPLVVPTPAGIEAGVLGQKPIHPHSGEECGDSGAEDEKLPRHGVPRGLVVQPSGRLQSVHCCPHVCMVSGPGSKLSSVTVKRMASPWRRWK